MKRTVCLAVLALICLAIERADASDTLSKLYSMTLGEVIAVSIPQLLTVVGLNETPAVCTYDKDAQTITIFVYGSRSTSDGAKESLEKYRNQLTGAIATMLNSMYGVALGDGDFTLVYENKNKEVLRREKGQYLMK